MNLSVTRDRADRTVLELDGDVDLGCVDALWEAAQAALRADDYKALLVDLSRVRFIDSTGLGTLVRIRNVTDGAVVLLTPSPQVLRVLELGGLDQIFTIG
jgi:anti-sigma B factor antagonist